MTLDPPQSGARLTLAPDFEQAHYSNSMLVLGEMYAALLEIDQMARRYGLMLDKLQPSAHGKLTVRFLVPDQKAQRGKGKLLGRRPVIVRWRKTKDQELAKRKGTRLTAYDRLTPGDALLRQRRTGPFEATFDQCRAVLRVLVQLLNRRAAVFKAIHNANAAYTRIVPLEKRRVLHLEQQAVKWEPLVEETKAKAQAAWRKTMAEVEALLEDEGGEGGGRTPVKPNPSKVQGRSS